MSTDKRPVEPFYRARGQQDAEALVHGKNPAFLLEKIVRERVLDSLYYRDQCFGLTAATILDRCVELDHVGGTHGVGRPTDFICLFFKLLQIYPSKDIVLAYLRDHTFKYLRALVAMFVRFTFVEREVFETLEPLLKDYRKLRVRSHDGSFRLDHIDSFIDQLLTESRVFDIALPPLMTRTQLEERDELEPRESPLQAEIDGEA